MLNWIELFCLFVCFLFYILSLEKVSEEAKQEFYWSLEFLFDVRISCCVTDFLVGVQNPCIAKYAAEICSTLQFSQKNREVPQESTKLQVGWEDV